MGGAGRFRSPRRRNENESGSAEGQSAAMAGPRPGSFPLLVRGDWGTAEPPAALRKKLLLYFQSPKRSGGGECELRGGPGQLLVCFAQPEGEPGPKGGCGRSGAGRVAAAPH